MTDILNIFTHALYEPHQPLLNAKLAKSPPHDMSGYAIKCLFQINKGHVQCLVHSMELYLQLVYNEYGVWSAASRHEVKLYVIDAHLLS